MQTGLEDLAGPVGAASGADRLEPDTERIEQAVADLGQQGVAVVTGADPELRPTPGVMIRFPSDRPPDRPLMVVGAEQFDPVTLLGDRPRQANRP